MTEGGFAYRGTDESGKGPGRDGTEDVGHVSAKKTEGENLPLGAAVSVRELGPTASHANPYGHGSRKRVYKTGAVPPSGRWQACSTVIIPLLTATTRTDPKLPSQRSVIIYSGEALS